MDDLVFEQHKETGRIVSVRLYGTELLNGPDGGQTDLTVNGLPLKTRAYPPCSAAEADYRLKGEHFFRNVVADVYEMERD